MRASVDIETALYTALTDDGYSASAHAIPSALGSALPHIHVERTGGWNDDLVVDTHQVDFDVYASDAAEAMETACMLCGWIRELTGETLVTPCYDAEVTTLPYANHDPRHPTIARATIKAQILTRTREV